MNARRAALDELFAQAAHHVQTKGFDGCGVVAKRSQTQTNPTWNFCAASIAETHQLRAAGDGHDAGDNGNVDAVFAALLHKIKIRIGVVKILRDAGIGTCAHFSGQGLQISFG